MGALLMSNDGHGNAGRLSSTEEDAVFAPAVGAPLSQPSKDVDSSAGRASAISSGPFEISPTSFSSPPSTGVSGPPSAVVQNALGRGRQQLSLAAIVGIGAAIFVVLMALSLLLFR